MGGGPAGLRRRDRMMAEENKRLIVGRITGLYGVRGWVRIHSFTEPRENVLGFEHWLVGDDEQWAVLEKVEGRCHGKGVVARIAGHDDRDKAATLVGKSIAVERDQLPPLDAGEYYWTDLEGLEVRTSAGYVLGTVDHLFATGANDVLVVKGEREHLIPFLPDQVVRAIHLTEGWMEVDWDPEF